jgi:hypothetical protein
LEAVDASARFWQMLPNDEIANSLLPVVDSIKIPVRGIVLVMLAFILLIGPANLVVLNRLNRRTWMLWTIPAISLVTCGLVFIYSMVREGFTPDSRMESVTLLDQANRRATSLGALAYYCPLTPDEGLRFSADSEVTPLLSPWDHRSGTPRELDWTQDQHLRRGWVSARVPAHFLLRKSETRRERLQLEREGEALEAVNGLGSRVLSLLLADSTGNLYQAAGIEAGQKAALHPVSSEVTLRERLGPNGLFLRTGFGEHSDQLSTNAVAYLIPGTYLAELEESPFVERGLSSPNARRRSRAFVYGLLESGAPTP